MSLGIDFGCDCDYSQGDVCTCADAIIGITLDDINQMNLTEVTEYMDLLDKEQDSILYDAACRHWEDISYD